MEKIEGKVFMRAAGNGFVIHVNDQFTEGTLAVTREELEELIKLGQHMLETAPITKP